MILTFRWSGKELNLRASRGKVKIAWDKEGLEVGECRVGELVYDYLTADQTSTGGMHVTLFTFSWAFSKAVFAREYLLMSSRVDLSSSSETIEA